MKKIITAIANPQLNEKLKKEKLEVIGKDIIYKEGILDMIEKEKQIDIVIISDQLIGEIKEEELIKKIRKLQENIEIIYILQKENKDLEEKLKENNITNILYNDKLTIQDLLKIIKKEDNLEQTDLKKEIEQLKEIIQEKMDNKNNNKKINFNKIKNIIPINKKNNKKIYIKENKIIAIIGNKKVGKSTIILNLARALKQKNKKILLVDHNLLYENMNRILGLKDYEENTFHNIKGNSNIFFYQGKWKESKKIKNEFEYILIELSQKDKELNKKILKQSDNILFIIEPDLMGINDSKKIQENILNKDIKNIKIIINKYNRYAIDKKILKIIYEPYQIIGKINWNPKYRNYINRNYNLNLKNKKIEKEYKKIIKEI